ncbi:MAG TPA: hypothetical protein VFZ28_10270 [Burkholderiaceae bacterium]|nr:hypothetical protein [Burkholderiaceae bacterium]
MDASRRDYFREPRVLQRQLAALLVAGVAISWLMSVATSSWLELACVALLMLCGAGVFIVSARLFTRHHPTISLFSDRLWFRGLREEVVMLRNVRDARLVESRVAGWTRRSIQLRLTGDDEAHPLSVPLDAVAADPAEVLSLICERAAQQREQAAR